MTKFESIVVWWSGKMALTTRLDELNCRNLHSRKLTSVSHLPTPTYALA